ncbi:hypothetical protein [Candidatus Nitrosocosmicus sp. SS]|jgi:hypothetical protein|nr:hypothetical protein [Candidatus Nitrosocosmicus sp. SS]
MVTTIQVSEQIREALKERGRKDQTYDEIIKQLLEKVKNYSANPGKLAES